MIKYQDGTTEKITTIDKVKAGPVSDSAESKNIDLQIEKAKSTKNIGIGLFVPGILVLLQGGVIYAFSSSKQYETSEQKSIKNASYIFFGISVPLVISGAIVYGIGQSGLNALEKRKTEGA